MAISSKCPKCENTSFELKTEKVENSRYPYCFVRCSSCGTVIGVTENHNVSYLVKKLAEKLNVSLD